MRSRASQASRRVDTGPPIALDMLSDRLSLDPMRRSAKCCVKILHSAAQIAIKPDGVDSRFTGLGPTGPIAVLSHLFPVSKAIESEL